MIIVMMGVAGSGKSTVGRLLAQQAGWIFIEGDEFHSPSNVQKMGAGIPLTDADRLPWLQEIRAQIERCQQKGESAVVACSALKASYRGLLAKGDANVRFVLLDGSYTLFYERLAERKGHFMKAAMLQSQFEALEVTSDLIIVPAADPLEKIVASLRSRLAI